MCHFILWRNKFKFGLLEKMNCVLLRRFAEEADKKRERVFDRVLSNKLLSTLSLKC